MEFIAEGERLTLICFFALTVTSRLLLRGFLQSIGKAVLVKWKRRGNASVWTPDYFPMQNRLKITPSKSSDVNSPVIELSSS
jgi:hypothetical protein